jgi:predicted amidohydrolase YtcJ
VTRRAPTNVAHGMRLTLSILALSVPIASCASDAASKLRSRDLLIDGGTIYLGAPGWRSVEALVVRDGRVAFAGSASEARERAGASAEHVDLRGGFAVPGLQDAHGHVESYGQTLESVDLRGASSLDAIVERVLERARATPKGEWIRGRGWDQNLFADKRFPTHAKLSTAVPDHPVYLERVDGHAGFVNRAALELARLSGDLRGQDRMQGGEILLDANGEATGVLIDNAKELVTRVIPPPDRATRVRRIERAERELVSLGLTAVHDMSVPADSIELFRELHARSREHPRVIAYVWGNDGLSESTLRELPIAESNGFEAPGVKLMIDGALGSRGAALLEDYSDAPGERGHLLVEETRLRELVELCATHHLQPAVHAIGDRGNRIVLDAFEASERAHPDFASLRPRVEHAQVVAREDWPRFERLHAIPSMQPTHATSDMPWAQARVGADRIAGAYAWKRLRSSSAPLAFGSDFPVESPNPLEGLYAAITRQAKSGAPAGGWTPDQRLSAADALEAFTLGAAFAAREEDRRGKLEPGWGGDVTVLDLDPLHCDPRELLRGHVLCTIVDGRVAFARGER